MTLRRTLILQHAVPQHMPVIWCVIFHFQMKNNLLNIFNLLAKRLLHASLQLRSCFGDVWQF
jgi:hypothetical protein